MKGTHTVELKIKKEFKDLIPPLSEEERSQLEDSIINQGCYTPLVVWKDHGILLDGHNRYELCNKHDRPFAVREVSISCEQSAKGWIILNQLSRRNLKPDQMSYLRGQLYNSRKKDKSKSLKQNDPRCQNDTSGKTAEIVAKETGVSPSTVMRDAKKAEQADKDGTAADIMAGKTKRKRKAQPKKQAWEKVFEAFTKLKPDQMKKAIESIHNYWDAH